MTSTASKWPDVYDLYGVNHGKVPDIYDLYGGLLYLQLGPIPTLATPNSASGLPTLIL
jgi:hypothetical protein